MSFYFNETKTNIRLKTAEKYWDFKGKQQGSIGNGNARIEAYDTIPSGGFKLGGGSGERFGDDQK